MDPQPAPLTPSASKDARPAAGASAREAALRAEAERNIAVLAELRERAHRFAEAIRAQAMEADAPKVVEGDVGLAYARATRAVRLAVTLQQRLIEEALRPGDASGASGGAAAASEPPLTRVKIVYVDGPTGELFEDARDARPWTMAGQAEKAAFRTAKDQALGVVRGVAAAALLPGELSPREEQDAVDRIEREAAERFEGRERESEREFTQLMRRPFSEIVAQICRDIGLQPDWEVLAGEAWAQDEMASERVGAPLAPFFSSPASGGGGPRSGGGGAGPESAPSDTPLARRAAFPAGGEGEGPS